MSPVLASPLSYSEPSLQNLSGLTAAIVVEHKPETTAIADYVVDLGPRAGSQGGEVVFTGSVDKLREADTLTGRHLADRAQFKEETRTPSGAIEIHNAQRNNLRGIDVYRRVGLHPQGVCEGEQF